MPRMDHNPKKRVSFGCREDVLDEFDAICDDEDVSRSERLRALVKQDVARHSDDDQEEITLPAERRLEDAYLTLLDAAEPVADAGLRVSRQEAINRLYTNDTPKNAVMDSLVRPLKKRGFVKVDPSMNRVWITVRPPE
jgi:hypothetical protein